jgi:mono/diheme cytochrome c family protein
MWLILASASLADDGAALYKSRCSACHGVNGEGKASMKAPALRETSLDAVQITEHITIRRSNEQASAQQRHPGRQ